MTTEAIYGGLLVLLLLVGWIAGSQWKARLGFVALAAAVALVLANMPSAGVG